MKSWILKSWIRAGVLSVLGVGLIGVGDSKALQHVAERVEVAGVTFAATTPVGDKTLHLNGAGLRKRVFFKVYAAGLYVPEKSSNAAALLAQTGPRQVRLVMLRNVEAETFIQSLNDGLRNNHSEAQLAALKTQIDALNANLKALGEAKKGDTILFEFTPQTGTRLIVNGQPKGEAIGGEAFFAAVLRVWIGDKPADGELKKGLLGGG